FPGLDSRRGQRDRPDPQGPGSQGGEVMFRKLMSTERDYAMLVARLALGIVMFAHGAQKVLGWAGGQGPQATVQGFQQHLGIPPLFGWLDVIAEFAGSLALILDLFGRVAAFGIGCVMLVAISLVHLHNGFFMNWTGNAPGEGFEYHLLALGIVLAVMIRGSGA